MTTEAEFRDQVGDMLDAALPEGATLIRNASVNPETGELADEGATVFWDRVLDDGELLNALERIELTRETVKQHRKARKAVKEAIAGWKPGERVRVVAAGRDTAFVITVEERAGDGVTIEPWVTKVAVVSGGG